MHKTISKILFLSFITLSLFAIDVVRHASAKDFQGGNRVHIIKEVRHELVTLPYYGVFDWLEFEVGTDNKVVLRGQVVRPTTKSDAESRAREVEGVSQVVNEIQVLPVSRHDDQLRLALYRTIYGWNSPLFRYATQTVPPIHIIVRNGRAALKGVVATKGDGNLAYIRARGVPGLFEVTNELKAESEMPR